jgi:hypothetical protein
VTRRPVRPSWSWLRPYVPFVLLTLGYLALRYALFGEVAREGRLNAERFNLFLQNVSTHLRRMAFGEAGLKVAGWSAAARVCAAAVIVGVIGTLSRQRERAVMIRAAAYFLLVWIALGLAPTVVAGYGSPRHMYLASVGWALALGAALDVLWHARPPQLMKTLGVLSAGAILVGYGLQLRDEVRLWGVRSDVSRRVVGDLEREASAAPPGTLIIVDPPPRSWNFALPHALRPPFTPADLPARVSIISHSSIHCCASYFWEPYTRRTMRTWMENPARPPVIALRWDPDTGQLFRLRDDEDAFLRALVPLLLATKDVTSLDRLILNITNGLVVKGFP